jgi:hypothetical protein
MADVYSVFYVARYVSPMNTMSWAAVEKDQLLNTPIQEGKKIENTKDWQYMSVNFEHQILFRDTRNQFLTVSAGMGHHIAFKFYHKISKLNN